MLEIAVKKINQIDHSVWDQCKNYIKQHCQNDPLYDNYIHIDPRKYSFFNCALLDDRIVSFGAVEISEDKWGPEIARVLTRFWIHPDFRSRGLTKWGDHNIRFSPLILKPQLEFLDTIIKIKVAMITREGKYKKSFQEISRLASTVISDSFEIADKVYNVCVYSDDPKCYQMISLASISGHDKWDILNSALDQGYFTYKQL